MLMIKRNRHLLVSDMYWKLWRKKDRLHRISGRVFSRCIHAGVNSLIHDFYRIHIIIELFCDRVSDILAVGKFF